MEYVLLGLCAVNLLLLVFLLLRSAGGMRQEDAAALEKELARLRQEADADQRLLLDQLSRQGEASSGQLAALGDGLRASQDRQQFRAERSMETLRQEMGGFRKETGDQLTQINAVVTEKLQTILDRKLNEAFDTVVLVTIHEGRNRQVRRMFEAIGHQVVQLRRIGFGPISLEDLPRGAWRRLTAAEVKELKAL